MVEESGRRTAGHLRYPALRFTQVCAALGKAPRWNLTPVTLDHKAPTSLLYCSSPQPTSFNFVFSGVPSLVEWGQYVSGQVKEGARGLDHLGGKGNMTPEF